MGHWDHHCESEDEEGCSVSSSHLDLSRQEDKNKGQKKHQRGGRAPPRKGPFRTKTTTTRSEKKKTYTTTTERKSFGELFWPKRKLSRPVVNTKTLWKPGKPYLPPKSFLCGPHFFRQRKFCTGAGRCMLSFSQEIAKIVNYYAVVFFRRPPHFSSNLCPPKTFAIWLFKGVFLDL